MTDLAITPTASGAEATLLGRLELDGPVLTRRQLAHVVGGGALAGAAAAGVAAATWPASGTAGEISRGLGAWTSFGTVAVIVAQRRSQGGDASATGHAHAASPGTADAAWTDEVTLDLAVHNGTGEPVLLSPGQLRLRLSPDGTTVTPRDADRGPGPIGAGVTETVRISYLAPAAAEALSAEFTDPRMDDVLLLELPSSVQATSSEGAGA